MRGRCALRNCLNALRTFFCKPKNKYAPKSTVQNWLTGHGLASLNLKTPFLEATFDPNQHDSDAAWELYVELLTRTATQPLPDKDGDEKAALDSVYSLFQTTREILKRKGRHCKEFTKIAIAVLNQEIRPFTTKWHKLSPEAWSDKEQCHRFREELQKLQGFLAHYTRSLADLADVEDLTDAESTDDADTNAA